MDDGVCQLSFIDIKNDSDLFGLKSINHFFAHAHTLDTSLFRVVAASRGLSTIRLRRVSYANSRMVALIYSTISFIYP